MTRQYRRIPTRIIAAEQFTQAHIEAHLFDKMPLPRGVHLRGAVYRTVEGQRMIRESHFSVTTIREQQAAIVAGDWIIPEADGEHFYPCKPDLFEATYEPVEPVKAPALDTTLDTTRDVMSDVRSAEADLRLGVIRAELDEITPGPWDIDDKGPGVWHVDSGGTICSVNFDNQTGDHQPQADQWFIACAPGNMAFLLDQIATAEALTEAANEVVERASEWERLYALPWGEYLARASAERFDLAAAVVRYRAELKDAQ